MPPPGDLRAFAAASKAPRASTELLKDSVFSVYQIEPALSPAGTQTLQADDPYAAPSAGGVDDRTGFAWAADAYRCVLWRGESARPTCYEFSVASTAPPHCVILPRPLNAAGEPAVLLVTVDGALWIWGAVSDAYLGARDGASDTISLLAGERITSAARCDDMSAVVGTSAGRLFSVVVYTRGGRSHVAHSQFAESRGLLGRWLGGASAARPVHRVTTFVNAADDEDRCGVLALGDDSMQYWSAPFAAGGAPARLVISDSAVVKSIASAVLYTSGRRYSAAEARNFSLADVAYCRGMHALAALYVDRSRGDERCGIAMLGIPVSGDTFPLERLIPVGNARAPDPSARAPRLVVADMSPAALVVFSDAVVFKLLGEDLAAFDESIALRPEAGRILGFGSKAHGVRCTALTTRAGVLRIDMDANAATQLARDSSPSSPHMIGAQAGRLQERLERAVWFEDESNPLLLDALDDDIDPVLLETAAERLSAAIVDSGLATLPPAVDLRTQLAQRVTCAIRLVHILGHNGQLARLSPGSRVQLRADAELLAGAYDLWRYYDESGRAERILHDAVVAALGEAPPDAERFFFQSCLGDINALFAALHGMLTGHGAPVVEITRLVLALFLGAARFRAEHGATYELQAAVRAPRVPWSAEQPSITLLEALFSATLQLSGDAGHAAEPRTQLCVLAEALLHAHAARVAALEASDAPDAAAARATYDAARPAVLNPLVSVGRADRAFALAEQCRDFATLTALCFADESPAPKRARRQNAEPTTLMRVEHYLDVYGAEFANELYTYYIQHGALRRLLEPKPEHAALVSAFLDEHPEYNRIAWVHNVALGDFERASVALRASARAETASIGAERSMLSLGKLAHAASLGALDAALETPAEQARLEAWDDALDVCHVQLRLAEKWGALAPLGAAPEAQAECVAEAATQLASPVLRALFVQLARGVAAGSVASGEDLVDLLSLQSPAAAAPDDAALDDFAVGVQLIARLDSVPESRRTVALATLWRRVYAQDDWAALSSTAERSDDEVIDEVRRTLAFRTVQSVLGNDSTAELAMSPAAAAAAPAADAAMISVRFPGMPAAEVAALERALADECDALAATLAETSLGAFYDQVLAQPIAYDGGDGGDMDDGVDGDDVDMAPAGEPSLPGSVALV